MEIWKHKSTKKYYIHISDTDTKAVLITPSEGIKTFNKDNFEIINTAEDFKELFRRSWVHWFIGSQEKQGNFKLSPGPQAQNNPAARNIGNKFHLLISGTLANMVYFFAIKTTHKMLYFNYN